MMNGHMFQSANEYKGIGARPASVDVVYSQHQQMCVNPHPGNLDNSIMEKKEGEMCFYFPVEFCVTWSGNNKLKLG